MSSPSSSSSPAAAAAAAAGSGSSSSTRTERGKTRTTSRGSPATAADESSTTKHAKSSGSSFLHKLAEERRAERIERAQDLSDAFGVSGDPQVVSSADVETAQQVGSAIAEQLLLALVQVQQDPSTADSILNFFAPEAICFIQGTCFTSQDFCRTLLTESVSSKLAFVSSSLEATGQVQTALPQLPASSKSAPTHGLEALHAGIAVEGSTFTVLSTLCGTLVSGGVHSPFRWRNRLVQHRATESWLVIASEFSHGEEAQG